MAGDWWAAAPIVGQAPPAAAGGDWWAAAPLVAGSPAPPAEDATAPAMTPPALPAAKPAAGSGAGATAFLDQLAAAFQKTSPIVASATGRQNYRLAPAGEQWKFQELGFPSDAQKYVALRDPASGQYQVYYRNPEMDEGGLTGIAKALGRALGLAVPESGIPAAVAAPTASQRLLQDFEASGVTPNLPAVGQGRAAGLTSQIARSLPVTGPVVQAAAGRTLGDTARAAERLAGAYGAAASPEEAGAAVRNAIGNFAAGAAPEGMTAGQIIAAPTAASSFGAKSAALYDRFNRAMAGSGQIEIPNTLAALRGPAARFPTSPELGAALTNPRLQSFLAILAPRSEEVPAVFSSIVDAAGAPILRQAAQTIQRGGTLSFPELAELRSTIGRAISDPMLVADIPRADLKAVYAAISDDLRNAAAAQGPNALLRFQQAAAYYRAGMQRLDQLEPLLRGSPEQTFAALNRAASTGGGANAGLLRAVQRSMPPDQWRQVGAAVIRQMGQPAAGARDVLADSFSPAAFATNWNRLSEAAKDALFGANAPGSNRASLEALARVAQAQKNVARLANASHSGEYAVKGGLAALAIEHGEALMAHPLGTVAGLLGARLTAQALMSPGFARWLYAMPRTVATAPNGMVAAQRLLSGLNFIAGGNPTLQRVREMLQRPADASRQQAPGY